MISWNPQQAPVSISGLRQGDLIGGKYRVEGVIGEGGMGVVLYATHLDLDRPVAIKLVRADLSERDEVVSRMLHEARAAANIRSEHVARVLDVGRLDSGSPYIVMEYLEGCDLCTLLEHHGRLASDLATDFIIQACEALAEAHSLNIVHRDLKPENLFLTTSADGEPIIKVLDFGISKELGRPEPRAVTNPSSAIGSPHYMAPEQMRALQNVDSRADIWALGAILFELVTGRAPFDAENLAAVCASVVSDEPPRVRDLVKDVAAGLDAVIWRCLRKDPKERYATVADFAAALAPYGAPGSALSAERVSRISATTYRRSIMRLPMPSRDGSPLPRSLVPISVTAHGLNGLAISASRVGIERETKRLTNTLRSRKMVFASGMACASVLIAVFAWTNSGQKQTADEHSAAVQQQLPASKLATNSPPVHGPSTPFAQANSETPVPHRSVADLPQEPAGAAEEESADERAHGKSQPRTSRARRSRGVVSNPKAQAAADAQAKAASLALPNTPSGAPAVAPATSPAPKTGVNAWDTNQFGGRR
ncbi:MAG TPA: serine/threonine-protein kinase [Polyangiaceae bacterium]|nr:serine/threonine-protein kinase [Polyangiaceae bacterium]